MAKLRELTVRLISGREVQFEFEAQGTESGVAQRIQRLIESPMLALRVGNEVVMYPKSAIEEMRVIPKSGLGPTVDLGLIEAKRVKR